MMVYGIRLMEYSRRSISHHGVDDHPTDSYGCDSTLFGKWVSNGRGKRIMLNLHDFLASYRYIQPSIVPE